MTKVSVVMPVYNSEKYVAESIESVLAQTYQDFEIIVVDDASTDRSVEIIKSYSDPRIHWFVNERNLGIAANWNRCISLARGEIINIFHADDIMLPGCIERTLNFFGMNTSIGLIYSKAICIDQNGRNLDGEYFIGNPDFDMQLMGFKCFERLLFNNNFICCPSVFVRRECYEMVGRFDLELSYSLDLEMWMRIALYYDVGFLVKPSVKYRIHANQLSQSYQGQNTLKGDLDDFRAIEKAIHQYSKSQHYNRISHTRMAQFTHKIGRDAFFFNDKRLARRFFKISLKEAKCFIVLFRYVSTFLPAVLIQMIRVIRGLIRRSFSNLCL